MLSMLAIQVLGIAAIAAAVFWLLRSPEIAEFAEFAAESPGILMTIVVTAFNFAVLLFSTGSSPGRPRASFSSA
jgi:hypothetical protein